MMLSVFKKSHGLRSVSFLLWPSMLDLGGPRTPTPVGSFMRDSRFYSTLMNLSRYLCSGVLGDFEPVHTYDRCVLAS